MGWVLTKQILYFYKQIIGKPTELAPVTTQASTRPNYKVDMFFVLNTPKDEESTLGLPAQYQYGLGPNKANSITTYGWKYESSQIEDNTSHSSIPTKTPKVFQPL
jgi:hypothetical protein